MSESHAIGNTGGNRNNILYRAPRFHTDEIGAGIDSSAGSMKFGRNASCKPFIVRRECQGCWEPLRHFLCKTGTGQYPTRRDRPKLLLRNLMRQLCRLGLESLASPDYWHSFSAGNNSAQ